MRMTLLAAAALLASLAMAGQAPAADGVPTVPNGLSGVVGSSQGPEAGVWVIAETKDLGTRYIKIVVTDDKGRYAMPDLPPASYKVWVRGYGLVDSKPVTAKPSTRVDLQATVAPSPKEAARYYPASYWYALLQPPAASEFPGTGPKGNGIAASIKTQQQWLVGMKEGCLQCHQIGSEITREIAEPTAEAWRKRVQQARPPGDPSMGPHGAGYASGMSNNLTHFGPRGAEMYADWSRRLVGGEIPSQAPPRPTGIERNVVLTMWDWAFGSFVHDQISTDRRDPTVNAGGPLYGAAAHLGKISVLDPRTHTASVIEIPTRDKQGAADTYPHTVTMDHKGRVWSTNIGYAYQGIEFKESMPSFCTDLTASRYGSYFPITGKKAPPVVLYDPATKKVELIDTCFYTHHLNFARDANHTIYFSGDTNIISWVDSKVWDETRDAQKAVGWCPMVLNTKKTADPLTGDTITPDRKQWNQPQQPNMAMGEAFLSQGQTVTKQDPAKDTRINGFLYGMEASPADESVWFLRFQPLVPTGILRFDRGTNPPATCRTEYYEPPRRADGSYLVFNGRGVSVDSKGVVWASFASGSLGAFDRGKCKVRHGPTSTGQHCPEGWTFYPAPGPKFRGVTDGNADFHYAAWVDLYDTFGLGMDVTFMPGTNSDSLLALDKASGDFHTFRVPYPMGFYTRGVDGRIDNAGAGWKGKGLWATYSDVPTWHQEDGLDGSGPGMVHFQLRPDPLAH